MVKLKQGVYKNRFKLNGPMHCKENDIAHNNSSNILIKSIKTKLYLSALNQIKTQYAIKRCIKGCRLHIAINPISLHPSSPTISLFHPNFRIAQIMARDHNRNLSQLSKLAARAAGAETLNNW